MRHYSSTAISAHCHSKFRPVVIAHNYQVVCHCEAFAKRCGNLYTFLYRSASLICSKHSATPVSLAISTSAQDL